jgi:glycosyltransferase involved in cell wall biosynthesis
MNVIHLILGKANPERMNGVNKYVFNLATEQIKRGIDVQVWGITADIESKKPVTSFTIQLFKAGKSGFHAPIGLKNALANIDEKQTVFHLHGGWIPTFGIIAKWLVKNKLQYIFTPHGAYNSVAMLRSKWQKKVYFYLFEEYLLKHAFAVHALGASEMDGLRKIMPAAKQILILPGFKPNTYSLLPRKIASIFTLSWCGRLDTHTKGLDILLKSIHLVSKKGIVIKLKLIGDGPGRSQLEELKKSLQIDREVQFCGSLFGQEKDNEILASDVFVHPSRNEGLPTAVLEAAAMYKPCMVSAETNIGTYISTNEAGWVVSPNSPKVWVEKIEEAYQYYLANKLETLGVHARKMIEHDFDWPFVVDQLQNVYKNALKEK